MEPDPWSPRWVREKLRERNNGLPPNDPAHDHKQPAGHDPPLCKCELDSFCYISWEYDTYQRRYWVCALLISAMWPKQEEKRKVNFMNVNKYCNNHVNFVTELILITMTISRRVFGWSCSHLHQNRQDVTSSSGLTMK